MKQLLKTGYIIFVKNNPKKGVFCVSELEKVTIEKLEYMENYIENGGEGIYLRKKPTFFDYFKREQKMIAERKKKSHL